ncbi:hypothetical protein [uncultured Amphritea sp.]|uniref:hypothetical protein n=1 Tax=uncultured Amphritea sp. TaxID=981605 RepID=UPI002637B08E|nr:hypothetical protein [uncultured Amphritea sp.]
MTSAQAINRELPDVQNLYIKERLASSILAVNVLAALGLTVLSINIETAKPKVHIQHGKACERLQNVSYKFWPTNSGRRKESVAFVSGCEVHWEEPA